MREEVNRLSGADTDLICQLAEKLLTTACKDVRVATYYLWARLHRDGETGLADGLTLLAGVVSRFSDTVLPLRAHSRKVAMEWLTSSKVLDSLSRYPEVVKADVERTVAALALLDSAMQVWPEEERPSLGGLYSALDARLAQAGGLDAVVPQNSAPAGQRKTRDRRWVYLPSSRSNQDVTCSIRRGSWRVTCAISRRAGCRAVG